MRPHYTSPVTTIARSDCETLLRLAISEDAPAGDPTSEAIFGPERRASARLIAREPGVLCGVPLLRHLGEIFREMTGLEVDVRDAMADGSVFAKGDALLSIEGSVRGILRIERLMLNFLQYLSGIATVTHDAVSKSPPGVFVLDTRKTLPGYRRLVKYAVYTGGGTNHRIDLSEMAMIKDNHIAAAGSITRAMDQIAQKYPGLPIEVEVDSESQIPEALAKNPRVLLLDNMDAQRVRSAVALVKRLCAESGSTPPIVEISGGWTPARLADLAGLDLPVGVSMGFLTHTTRFLDLSLEVTEA